MAMFLITYHGMNAPNIDYMVDSRKAFRAWIEEKGLGDAIVHFGTPTVLSGQISKGAPADAVEIDGFTIIRARSLSDARVMLEDHPYVGRGGTIQINECIEV